MPRVIDNGAYRTIHLDQSARLSAYMRNPNQEVQPTSIEPMPVWMAGWGRGVQIDIFSENTMDAYVTLYLKFPDAKAFLAGLAQAIRHSEAFAANEAAAAKEDAKW